jgi:hypothetical protein
MERDMQHLPQVCSQRKRIKCEKNSEITLISSLSTRLGNLDHAEAYPKKDY